MIHDFTHFTGEWRGKNSSVSGLERLSVPRMTFMRECFQNLQSKKKNEQKPIDSMEGLKILDLGCGGGLVSEALCRLGANVLAVDANANALKRINTPQGSHGSIRTLCIDITHIEKYCQPESFDAIVCLEVLEHLPHPAAIITIGTSLLRKGGSIVLSTLNRTPLSFVLGILYAEYFLKWSPHGSHDFQNFIKPREIITWMQKAGLRAESPQGMSWSYSQGGFVLSSNCSVNYIIAGWKDF